MSFVIAGSRRGHPERLEDAAPQDLGVGGALEPRDHQPERLVAQVRVVPALPRLAAGRQVAQAPDLEDGLGRAIDAGRDPGRVAQQVPDRDPRPGAGHLEPRQVPHDRIVQPDPTPSSTSCMTMTAQNVFPIDPISNRVSGATGRPLATSASPYWRSISSPSRSVTASVSPGMDPFDAQVRDVSVDGGDGVVQHRAMMPGSRSPGAPSRRAVLRLMTIGGIDSLERSRT